MIKYSLHVKSVILCNHSLIQAGFYAFFYFLNEQLVADADVLSLSFSSSHNSTLMRYPWLAPLTVIAQLDISKATTIIDDCSRWRIGSSTASRWRGIKN